MQQVILRCDVCGEVIKTNYATTVIDLPAHTIRSEYENLSVKVIINQRDVCKTCAHKLFALAYQKRQDGLK